MKGIVFTEFLDLVEERFGLDVEDRIIIGAKVPNEGACTSKGLIRATIKHYKEDIQLAVDDLSGGAGTVARFMLTKKA